MNVLEEAQKIVEGDRKEEYGDMKESFNRIANMWSAYTGLRLSAHDVANMMILLKVSRNKNSPLKMDNIVDIVGYSICYEQLINELPKKMDKSNKD